METQSHTVVGSCVDGICEFPLSVRSGYTAMTLQVHGVDLLLPPLSSVPGTTLVVGYGPQSFLKSSAFPPHGIKRPRGFLSEVVVVGMRRRGDSKLDILNPVVQQLQVPLSRQLSFKLQFIEYDFGSFSDGEAVQAFVGGVWVDGTIVGALVDYDKYTVAVAENIKGVEIDRLRPSGDYSFSDGESVQVLVDGDWVDGTIVVDGAVMATNYDKDKYRDKYTVTIVRNYVVGIDELRRESLHGTHVKGQCVIHAMTTNRPEEPPRRDRRGGYDGHGVRGDYDRARRGDYGTFD